VEHRDAVREAYELYSGRLVAQAYALTGDYGEAQDVVHEAFARALSRPDRFAEVAAPEAWLRTVVLNVFRSRYRRRLAFDRLVRLGRVERQPADTPGISPDRLALVAALQQLPRGTREVLVLHHLADLPVVEVADFLQVSVSAVKTRLTRGRLALAALLDERDGSTPHHPERNEVGHA
jgi:RNA polymerase sigma-70 factor (ECF subfamily)